MARGAIFGVDNILIYGAINWPRMEVERQVNKFAESQFTYS